MKFGAKKSVFLHQKLPQAKFGAQKRHFPHRNLWRMKFGAKKSAFLRQKLPQAKFGAQKRHFRHRETGCQTVQCQKECFPAPKVASRGKWCINGAFSTPEGAVCRKCAMQNYLASSTVAYTAMASSRPTKPAPSVVVAFTDTLSGSTPRTPARHSLIGMM